MLAEGKFIQLLPIILNKALLLSHTVLKTNIHFHNFRGT